jgi:hypothetical protein
MLAVAGCMTGAGAGTVGQVWLAGAAALGLVSGFTTGAVGQTGIGTEFLKFLSAGIIAPLLGAVVTLLEFRKLTFEFNTYTASQQLESKVVGIQLPDAFPFMHPLWVLGAFFLTFSLGAVLGIVLGVAARRMGNIEIKVHG